MYRRYYDGYNTYDGEREVKEKGEVVVPEAAETVLTEAADDPADRAEIVIEDGAAAVHTASHGGGLFGGLRFLNRLEIDDLLLLGVIILLLHDSVDDSLLIAVLAVVFLAGLFD